MVMSMALFYKREIGIEDLRTINPTAFRDAYDYRRTIVRLEELAFVRRNEDRFQITEYGAKMLSAYEAWKQQNIRNR